MDRFAISSARLRFSKVGLLEWIIVVEAFFVWLRDHRADLHPTHARLRFDFDDCG